MTTFATLRNAVADDLERSDLATQIGTEINNAIREHSRRRLWFNQSRSLTFSTVAAQEFYGSADNASLPRLTEIDRIILTDGANRYQVIQVDNDTMELMDTPTMADNRPSHWAWVYPEMRLWPTPNAVYSVRVTGLIAPADLSGDTDSNIFTVNAFDLIRHSARRRVMANTLKDIDGATIAAEAERSALSSLNMQSVLLMGRGTIEATQF
jgi:hypothetical protein